MFTLKMFTLKLCSAFGGSVKSLESEGQCGIAVKIMKVQVTSLQKSMKHHKGEIIRPLEKDNWLLKGGHVMFNVLFSSLRSTVVFLVVFSIGSSFFKTLEIY